MSKTILVVDDEEVVVDITKKKLMQDGFSVIGVNDGEAAIEVLKQGLVDLIILDVEMPKMNGYTFIAERKKIAGAENIPIIVLTAYDSMEPIFKRHGIKGYLQKPATFQELRDKINAVLAGQYDLG
ncbi:MAG: response regulator [Candidatus Omnitrophica bacterium]|nr:response regulator [Candidatus Omnitrophota bacterium]